MIRRAPQLGQDTVLFQQCMALAQDCIKICDTIPTASVDQGTVNSLQADCDKCLEYGISDESVQQLGEIKSDLMELSEPAGTDWGAVVGGGAIAGILGLLLFGK